MPYIKQERRKILRPSGDKIRNGGELNYGLTAVIAEYLSCVGVTYASLNEVVGVLECAKLELYRRIAAPYEDQKMKENGDVY